MMQLTKFVPTIPLPFHTHDSILVGATDGQWLLSSSKADNNNMTKGLTK